METGNPVLSASTFEKQDQTLLEELLLKEKHIADLEDTVTELRDSLNDMRSLAKLGEMSAAVAHEIRNPLAGISATAEVLKLKLGDDERAEFADVIIDEISRLEKIVKDLLSYARIRKPYLAPMNIATELDRAFSATEHQLQEQNITLVRDYHSTDIHLSIDAEQMHQVFLNVILNAADAMATGGILTISLRSGHDLSHKEDRELEQSDGPGYVEIEFADNGKGVSGEDLEKIFDPFFSTRATGTGLGLAVCRKILKQHSASITARNRQEGGAAFAIRLPLTGNGQSQQQANEF